VDFGRVGYWMGWYVDELTHYPLYHETSVIRKHREFLFLPFHCFKTILGQIKGELGAK